MNGKGQISTVVRHLLLSFALALLAGCVDDIKERNWLTMGTTASVKVKGASADSVNGCASTAREIVAVLEQLLNAHDPASELSRIAPLDDAEVIRICDAKVKGCYETAFKLRDQSGGVFNPRWKGRETMDLGAIAKGFAVDFLADGIYMCLDEKSPLLFDIGGNLRARSGSWTVGIAGSEQTIVLTNGMACATSAEYYRGKHIYDARTGNAVTNDLLSVTIVHPNSAMLADGLSTICFILGERDGEAFLKRFYPEARAIWIKKQ